MLAKPSAAGMLNGRQQVIEISAAVSAPTGASFSVCLISATKRLSENSIHSGLDSKVNAHARFLSFAAMRHDARCEIEACICATVKLENFLERLSWAEHWFRHGEINKWAPDWRDGACVTVCV